MITQTSEKCNTPAERGCTKTDKTQEQFSATVDILGPIFYSHSISDKAKLLYGLLAAMTRPPKYYAFAKNSTLCRYLACSERTLQKYMAELVGAGEVTIENGNGGNQLRKIKVVRLQPFYPAESCGVTQQNPAGVYNNEKNKKKKRKKEIMKNNPAEDEILRYIDSWAVNWDADPTLLQKLVKDLHAFFDFRKAKNKPIITFGQADYALTRLGHRSLNELHRVPAMCFMLESAVLHNWEEPYGIDYRFRHEYEQFLFAECGIAPAQTEGDDDEWL